MTFRALVLTQGADRKVSGAIRNHGRRQAAGRRRRRGDRLFDAELQGRPRAHDGRWIGQDHGPHVGGIDFAGTVETSENAAFKAGDKVVLNGYRVGELHWGGYATKARVKGDWLVRLPGSLSTRRAMAIGTAGYTSMLCVMALEKHGIDPAKGEILVTGAAGGGRLGRRRDPGQARLHRGRGDRAAPGGRIPQVARRHDHHGPQGTDRGAGPPVARRAFRRRRRPPCPA